MWDKLFKIDWGQMLGPDTSVLEIFLRGTVMYMALFLMLRIILKRQSGGVGITDLLVIVLIADAAQNGMAGDYKSITDGLLLVGTIIFWSFALDWLGYHFPVFERFIHPPALPLVKNGQMNRRNMRHELVTEDELMSQIRLQGMNDLSQVKLAYMESDGRISVISKEDKSSQGAPEKQIS